MINIWSWFFTQSVAIRTICDPELIPDRNNDFTSADFPSRSHRQTDGRTDGQMKAAGQTHVGVYLSTTTGRNTSTAEPGQGPWIWLGQAAIWMARGRKGGIRRNQPANQPNKTTWRMEQLQRGRRGNRGGWRRVGSSWRAACLPSQTPEEISWHEQI